METTNKIRYVEKKTGYKYAKHYKDIYTFLDRNQNTFNVILEVSESVEEWLSKVRRTVKFNRKFSKSIKKIKREFNLV